MEYSYKIKAHQQFVTKMSSLAHSCTDNTNCSTLLDANVRP